MNNNKYRVGAICSRCSKPQLREITRTNIATGWCMCMCGWRLTNKGETNGKGKEEEGI